MHDPGGISHNSAGSRLHPGHVCELSAMHSGAKGYGELNFDHCCASQSQAKPPNSAAPSFGPRKRRACEWEKSYSSINTAPSSAFLSLSSAHH